MRILPQEAVGDIQVLPQYISHIPFGYGNDVEPTQDTDTPSLIRLVEETYGPMTSFHGCLSADHWVVTLSEAPMSDDGKIVYWIGLCSTRIVLWSHQMLEHTVHQSYAMGWVDYGVLFEYSLGVCSTRLVLWPQNVNTINLLTNI